MEETREERQKRIANESKGIQVRAVLSNLDKIPFMTPEIKEKIQSGMKEFLPVIKDEIKSALASQSEKMGTGADRKIYVMRNGKDGIEVWTMQNMRAFDGDIVSKFSFSKIMNRIDQYQKAEELIADLVTGKLFSEQDYDINSAPPTQDSEEESKIISINTSIEPQQ